MYDVPKLVRNMARLKPEERLRRWALWVAQCFPGPAPRQHEELAPEVRHQYDLLVDAGRLVAVGVDTVSASLRATTARGKDCSGCRANREECWVRP
jgi:hypothetical protein